MTKVHTDKTEGDNHYEPYSNGYQYSSHEKGHVNPIAMGDDHEHQRKWIEKKIVEVEKDIKRHEDESERAAPGSPERHGAEKRRNACESHLLVLESQLSVLSAIEEAPVNRCDHLFAPAASPTSPTSSLKPPTAGGRRSSLVRSASGVFKSVREVVTRSRRPSPNPSQRSSKHGGFEDHHAPHHASTSGAPFQSPSASAVSLNSVPESMSGSTHSLSRHLRRSNSPEMSR